MIKFYTIFIKAKYYIIEAMKFYISKITSWD